MKAISRIVGGFLVFSMLFGGCMACSAKGRYNQLVNLDQNVQEKGAQVQNVYQRRFDLIPNVVETTKGYAAHEQETFKAIADARSRIGQMNLDPSKMTPDQMQNFEQQQGELGGFLSRLLALREAYPELKANTIFQDLVTELEGTENRIAVERREYNKAARDFNTTRNQFPMVLFASVFGFQEKAYFAAQHGAEKAPVVKF